MLRQQSVLIILVLTASCAPQTSNHVAPKETVASLTKDLESDDTRVREEAARKLGEMGPPAAAAIGPLLKATKDPIADVRCLAVAALGKIGAKPESVIPALEAALTDESWQVRVEAVRGLEKIAYQEKTAVIALNRALRSRDKDIQKRAAAALLHVESTHPAALQTLIQLLDDKNARIRRSAALTLGDPGNKAAVPALAKRLRDSDELVREASASRRGETPVTAYAFPRNISGERVMVQGKKSFSEMNRSVLSPRGRERDHLPRGISAFCHAEAIPSPNRRCSFRQPSRSFCAETFLLPAQVPAGIAGSKR
jgi:hypothetical protein